MGDGAWSSIFGLFDQDEDENSSAQQQGHWDNRDNLIIVIDCSPSMFQLADDDDDDYLPFQKSIRCCISLLKNKIISSDRDLIGIVFFATEKSKNRSDFKHVYVFQELDQPDAPRILDLERFLGDDSCDDFRDNYGYSDQFSMNDVLWTCSNMFSQSNQKTANKRIMLFTNNDNPHTDNRTLQNQAITKARDLFDIGITIELMHMCPPGGSFDASLFYQDIINVDDDELVALPDASVKFEELQAKVNKKEHKKRSMASIPFTLADGVDMGINVFNLCRPSTKSSCVNLNSRTNEEVRIHTKYICKDTGSELMPTDIKYYQMFGGEKVIFEKEEVAEMKSFGEPGLLLMGFKPKKALKRYYHIKLSNFIYPDEKSVSGSTTLFSALLTKSLDKDVVPICRYIPRATSAPYFVALLPQKEKFDEHNNQVNPAGFHVIFLPFADDLRKLDYPEAVKATTEQISKAKEIIKKLTFPFNATNFENPSLQKHYRHLEGLALDRDGPEEIEDLTEPDTERLDRRAGALMEEFKTLVYPEGYNPGAKPAAKRKTPGEGAAAKRAKTENVDVREEAMKGRLSKLTVPVLKDFAKLSGITAGTKKADIIAAINEHLGI